MPRKGCASSEVGSGAVEASGARWDLPQALRPPWSPWTWGPDHFPSDCWVAGSERHTGKGDSGFVGDGGGRLLGSLTSCWGPVPGLPRPQHPGSAPYPEGTVTSGAWARRSSDDRVPRWPGCGGLGTGVLAPVFQKPWPDPAVASVAAQQRARAMPALDPLPAPVPPRVHGQRLRQGTA